MSKSITLNPGSPSKIEVESTDLDIRNLNATDDIVKVGALDSTISTNTGSQLKTTTFDSSGNEGQKIIGIDYLAGNSGIDASTETLQVIQYDHHEIHSGNHYYIRNYVTLGSSAVLNIAVTTPDTTTEAHLLLSYFSSAQALFQVYEGATISTPGTTITPINSNRNSDNESALTVASSPTVATTGTVLSQQLLGSGTNPSNTKGGAATREDEIVLKRNTIYLIRITSNSASNNINYKAAWYEHTPKN